MKLERLANENVAVVDAEDPIDSAIQHMSRLNIRHLPVVCENVPVGIVSERDVLFHVCQLDRANHSFAGKREGLVSEATRIDQIMTRPVVTLSPEDSIENAARLMVNKRISSVPLVAHNNIVGIVTETDFLGCYNDETCLVPSQKTRQTSILEIMSAHVHCVQPDDSTHTAIRLMREKQIRHVAVVDEDELVGIVSDRDVLRGRPRDSDDRATSSAQRIRVLPEFRVRGIMTKRPEAISLSQTLAQAASTMVKHKIGALPVLENGKLSGIITETDLLRALVVDCR